jgi:hypothetical protein
MWLLLLLIISTSPYLAPDPSLSGVKIVTRQVSGAFSDTRTEYLTANNLRSEWQTHLGDRLGPPMASIIQRGSSNRVYLLDLQAHEYVTYESQSGAPGEKGHALADSGGVLRIWIDSVDTGERQEMFGHMARRVITREKRIASPGACARSSESESDGWYIDPSVLPEWHRQKKNPGSGAGQWSVITVNFGGCTGKMDKLEVHRTGIDPGFPLKLSTTTKSEEPDRDGVSRLVASNSGSEVMEFREGPLDPGLFQLPADFRRVEALKNWYSPAPRHQQTGWEWLKERLQEIFR